MTESVLCIVFLLFFDHCVDNFCLRQRRSSVVIEITGNNSEWSESEDQEDDTQDEGDMDIDEVSSSSNDNSTFSTT